MWFKTCGHGLANGGCGYFLFIRERIMITEGTSLSGSKSLNGSKSIK